MARQACALSRTLRDSRQFPANLETQVAVFEAGLRQVEIPLDAAEDVVVDDADVAELENGVAFLGQGFAGEFLYWPSKY